MGGISMPKTFSPSVMARPLAEHAPTRREDTVGEESESLRHLVAQPYSERRHKPEKVEIPKAKKVEVKPHAAENHEKKHGGFTVKTGAGLMVEGAHGVRRAFEKEIHHGRSTYAGLSHHDKDLYVDTVAKHARALPTGAKIGLTTKRKITESLRADKLAGKISQPDFDKFKKLTAGLSS